MCSDCLECILEAIKKLDGINLLILLSNIFLEMCLLIFIIGINNGSNNHQTAKNSLRVLGCYILFLKYFFLCTPLLHKM